MSSPFKRILILTANPKNTERLRLDEELRLIKEGLKRANQRDQFEIVAAEAVTIDGLRRAMLDYDPQIVHFSGHGAGEDGLALMNELGEAKLVPSEALADLFDLFKDQVECVLLNACYSEVQAKAIAQHVNYVIGMSDAVGDTAARKFAVGFYDGLGAGRTYEFSYKLGCNAIAMEGIPEHLIPIMLQANEAFVNITQGINTAISSIQQPQSTQSRELVETKRKLVLEQKTDSISYSNGRRNNDSSALSTVELDNPTGQVPIDSRFYVERPPIESDCYRTISNPGALILIKAPRQMGKTSLMSRILHFGKTQHDYRTAQLYLLEADNEVFKSPEIFLKWFCSSVTYELNLEDKVEEQWKSVVSNRQKCTNYFQRHLLSQIETPLVLGLDEVDRLFDHYEIAEAFFSLLRAWHERSKNEPIWQKLRLVLAHSQEVYISLNVNQSPFNVGQTVRLFEFNRSQVEDLVQRHGLDWSSREVDQLTGILDGHPYLLRIALYQVASGKLSLEKLLELAPTQEGPFGEHLRHHLSNLNADPKLRAAMKRLVNSDRPVELEQEQLFKLCSMGLAELRGNAVIPLCNLYRIYFRDRLRDN